jgi:Pyruvate/2-oxoglutarate dehydrogenase complex, dihydrolipoamide dehydrogenase (E3) component, and related enzymes
VIGAYGSAGVAAADRLAGRARLTLVDGGDPGGGLCILRGCMPSKEVLSAGAHRFQARHDDRLGAAPAVDPERVVARKDDNIADFAEHRRHAVHELADRDGVEFLDDTARLVDETTVAVGDRRIDADYVVVATGSTIDVPDIPGVDEVDPMTSVDVLDATSFPDSGVVMGFGYVGVELVPYLAEVGGTSLTVVEHDERPLDGADPAFGDAVLDIYEENFDVQVLRETSEQRVEPTEEGVRLHTDRDDEFGTVEADRLFAFTGRRPTVDGLGLENTPVEPREGWVDATTRAVDSDRVFVVGDANGREPVLHVAKEEGHLAAENVLAHHQGEPLAEHEGTHHRVMFAGLGVYPFARVGHTAETAREAGYDPIVATRQARDDGVFRTKDVAEGLARLVVARDGTVLGYQGLHYHADAMAKLLHVLVDAEMDVRSVPERSYHPTTTEIIDGLLRDASQRLA